MAEQEKARLFVGGGGSALRRVSTGKSNTRFIEQNVVASQKHLPY